MADYSRERHGRSEYSDTEDMDISSGRILNVERTPNTVGFQVERIQNELMKQDEIIKVLEERLAVIFAPELDGPGAEKSSDDSPLRTQSELAEQLQSYTDRIGRHTRRLSRMIDRINL